MLLSINQNLQREWKKKRLGWCQNTPSLVSSSFGWCIKRRWQSFNGLAKPAHQKTSCSKEKSEYRHLNSGMQNWKDWKLNGFLACVVVKCTTSPGGGKSIRFLWEITNECKGWLIVGLTWIKTEVVDPDVGLGVEVVWEIRQNAATCQSRWH